MTPEHEREPDTLGEQFDRLYRAAWALCGSREDAEELVHATFARVLARPRLVRDDNDLAYLVRTLRHAFESGRSAPRGPLRVPASLAELDLPESSDAPEPASAAQAREVYAAIAELPADLRDALVAVDVAGLSYRQAVRALGARQGTITSRLFRARRDVAGRLASPPS